MELIRQQEFVQTFYYDALPEKHTEKTAINVSINPFDIKPEMKIDAERNSVLGVRVEFTIVLDKVKISGDVAQFVQVIDRKIKKIEDLNSDEVNELVRPVFLLIERMTYELTEVALDAPGIKLNFSKA